MDNNAPDFRTLLRQTNISRRQVSPPLQSGQSRMDFGIGANEFAGVDSSKDDHVSVTQIRSFL